MSSQARSLRISNIQINVHSFTGGELCENEACNIVTWIVGGAFQDQTEFSVGGHPFSLRSGTDPRVAAALAKIGRLSLAPDSLIQK